MHTHVHTHTYIYIYTHIIYICMYVYIHIHTRLYNAHTHIHINMSCPIQVHACMYVCMYVMYVCMYVCMYVSIPPTPRLIRRARVLKMYVWICVCIGMYDAGLPHPPPTPWYAPRPPLWGGPVVVPFPAPPCGFVVVDCALIPS